MEWYDVLDSRGWVILVKLLGKYWVHLCPKDNLCKCRSVAVKTEVEVASLGTSVTKQDPFSATSINPQEKESIHHKFTTLMSWLQVGLPAAIPVFRVFVVLDVATNRRVFNSTHPLAPCGPKQSSFRDRRKELY
jgi:hypothetical protein